MLPRGWGLPVAWHCRSPIALIASAASSSMPTNPTHLTATRSRCSRNWRWTLPTASALRARVSRACYRKQAAVSEAAVRPNSVSAPLSTRPRWVSRIPRWRGVFCGSIASFAKCSGMRKPSCTTLPRERLLILTIASGTNKTRRGCSAAKAKPFQTRNAICARTAMCSGSGSPCRWCATSTASPSIFLE